MNNPNMFPMQPMAEQMAQQGRYGDSMMVHMNPIEVAGIASLSPTGQLTTNPMTGQPEAFLPFLAPLLGSMFGSTILGAAGSALGTGAIGSALTAAAGKGALASAIGSGLATTAVTGDLKEGLLSGLTGFGVGKALGAASQALNPAVEAAQTAVTEGTKTAASLGDALTKQETLLAGLTEGSPEALKATETISNLQGNLDKVVNPGLAGPLQPGVARPQIGSLTQAELDLSSAIADSNRNVFGAIKDSPGKFAAEAGKNLLSPGVAAPIAVAEGQRAAMAAQDERDRMFGRRLLRRNKTIRTLRALLMRLSGKSDLTTALITLKNTGVITE